MSASARGQFGWYTCDVHSWLPNGWQQDILEVASSDLAVRHELSAGGTVASREEPGTVIPTWTVDGTVIAGKLPWLTTLYRNEFLMLARVAFSAETVTTSADRNYGCNLNVMRGQQRYEAHVDTGLQAILFCTTHAPGNGGELTVANGGDVRGTDAVDSDATVIHPMAGHIIFFDARENTHYVRALTAADGIRVVASLPYYHPQWAPESALPADLKQHLYG